MVQMISELDGQRQNGSLLKSRAKKLEEDLNAALLYPRDGG